MQHRTVKRFGRLALLASLALVAAACDRAAVTAAIDAARPSSQLDQVRARGALTVVIAPSPTALLEGPFGQAGIEYDLAKSFAEHLGVELEVVQPGSGFGEVIPLLLDGGADMAVGLTVTPERNRKVRFTPSYLELSHQLVYRRGSDAPPVLASLAPETLRVAAGTAHLEKLHSLRREHPELSWQEEAAADIERLLSGVWQKEFEYTVADSLDVAYARRFYPEIEVAYDLGDRHGRAWAFSPRRDKSLYMEALRFLSRSKADGTLDQLRDRYFGHVESFDYVQTRAFLRHIDKRLPRYQPHFEEAAAETGLDWRLLAAMGYQESNWNPRAVSPTGVRGIMMLTLATAAHIGIENRIDPRQSIVGGARYFRRLLEQIPERIGEPDRTWLALAAYNVGFGHLEDARILAEHQGLDPDKWLSVKQALPLLRQPEWHKSTRYGFARGDEAVFYVERIRDYYEQLYRHTEQASRDNRVAAVRKDGSTSL